MKGLNVHELAGSLQALTSGRPDALQQLVASYAQSAARQLVPAQVAEIASMLPLDLHGDALALAPQKLEGAFLQVLGTLSPEALRGLQGVTQVLPGGMQGLLHAPADTLSALHADWFGQVGSHLLQEALPPQLQQFAAMGQQVLVASAGKLSLAGALAAPTAPAGALSPAAAEPTADTKENKAQKKATAPASKPKPPVKTGFLDAKKERYEQRMELVDKAEAQRVRINNPEFSKAIDRLKLNNIAVERFRLSVDVYNHQVVLSPKPKDFDQAKKLGYRVQQDIPAKNGEPRKVYFHRGQAPEGWWIEKIWDDSTTGLNAVLYKSTFERGGQPVLVFGGTELNRIGGPKIPLDVLADYNQAHTTKRLLGRRVPVARQYAKGIEVAREVVNQYPNASTAGHSLGGGLSTAASLLFNLKNYTFNAAGVHPDTVAPYGVTKAMITRYAGKTEAFHSSGDPLTKLQRQERSNNNWRMEFDGDDVPEAVGNQRTVGTGPHGPSGTGIEEGLEKQKAADTATIHQYLAGQKR